MEIFGCGYNGFGQLQPASSKRCFLSPVKICMGFCLDTNPEDPMLSASEKIMKLTSTWSTVHILRGHKIWSQGFYNGKNCTFQSLETEELQRNDAVDIDAGCEQLCYTTEDGECIAADVGSGQVSKVKLDEHGSRTRFLKVAVGDRNRVAITDAYSAGSITSENSSYIFHPFDCAVQFSQVHCGKEHVILLSQVHQVYSYGLGSRGQLGHGTTDGEPQPRLLEALGSISIDCVSAGGWHSAAVSTIGDLYVWGWNESGQLGFPMQRNSAGQRCSNSQDLLADRSYANQPSPEKPHSGVKRTLPQDAKQAERTKKNAISLESTGGSTILSQGGNWELDEREGFETSIRSHGNQTHQKVGTLQTDVHYKEAHQPLKRPSVQDTCCQKGGVTETKSTSNEVTEDRNYDLGDETDCSTKQAAYMMDGCCDNRDTVLFQPLPRILDLPNQKDVSKVSCGSRHTAAICEDGCLFTWGWDAYGQLGHGDTQTRDVPTMVKLPTEDQRVIDVSCGAWTTMWPIRPAFTCISGFSSIK